MDIPPSSNSIIPRTNCQLRKIATKYPTGLNVFTSSVLAIGTNEPSRRVAPIDTELPRLVAIAVRPGRGKSSNSKTRISPRTAAGARSSD